MPRILYRVKSPVGEWVRVTGTPPFTVANLSPNIYEVDDGTGVLTDVTVIDVPAKMAAPTAAVLDASTIEVTLAADPADNYSTITSRDLRYSTDNKATWTEVINVVSPYNISGLAAQTKADVETRAVNAAGAGPWSNTASATTSSTGTIAATSTNLIDYGPGAVTFTLDRNMPVFQWADGSYGILTDAAPAIVSGDTPASAPDADGWVMHGMELSPAIVPLSGGTQGLDQLISDAVLAKNTYSIAYDPALNIAPSRTGTPVTLASLGATGTAVKVVRTPASNIPTANGKRDATQILEGIYVITAVNQSANIGDIRPPLSGGGSLPSVININEADFSRVRAFTLPAGLPNTLATCKTYMRMPQLSHYNEGERRRGLCYSENYARDIIRKLLAPAALYMMDPNVSATDRQEILAGFMMRATDAYGAYQGGLRMWGGAGQIIADHFCVSVVSALCPNNTTFSTLAEAMRSNLNDQYRWADAIDIGLPAPFNSVAGPGQDNAHNQQPMLPEHVGYGYWDSRGLSDPDTTKYPTNSLPTARYRDVSYGMSISGIMVLGLIRNGWEKIFGPRASWTNTNNRFSAIMVMDQMRNVSRTPIFTAGGNDADDYVLTLWDAHRATMPEGGGAIAIQDAPPMQTSIDLVSNGFLTPTASGANYDYTALSPDKVAEFTGSTIPLTGREIRTSHDGVQFTTPVAANTTGSIAFTGTRWIQERRQNSLGYSPWSVNFPLWNGITGVRRNIVDGGTVPAGAPVNTEIPKLYRYRWAEESKFWDYVELTGTMPNDRQNLVSGIGLWQNGVLNETYQWQTRTNAGVESDIVGATSQTWLRDPALLSDATNTRDVRCKITVDDGLGASTITYSNWLTMPTKVTVDNTLSTEPTVIYADPSGATYAYQSADGSIRCTPNGTAFATVYTPIGSSLIAGATYDFSLEISAVNGSGQIDMRVGQVGVGYDNLGVSTARLSGPGTLTITGVVIPDGKEVTVGATWRGTAPAGAYYDITRITATPV
jgi:hypothetical protein